MNKGPIAWMVANPVAANLLMWLLLVGGAMSAMSIRQEVFPDFALDRVTFTFRQVNASPEQLVESVIREVKNRTMQIDGIDQVESTATRGLATVRYELLENADAQRVLQDIEQAIAQARLPTGPDTERPSVILDARRREVIRLVLYGNASEAVLIQLAETVQDKLEDSPNISVVEVNATKEQQIHVELNESLLLAHGLSVQDIAQRIGNLAVDRSGGLLETQAGDLFLRFDNRRLWATEFVDLPIARTPSGGVLTVGDLTLPVEGFEQTTRYSYFNGQPSIALSIYRVGDETPTGVADTARAVMADIQESLPEGISWAVQSDRADYFRQRRDLLLKNAAIGLALVIILLGLFLNLRVAFWVTMGIPISFLGGIAILPAMPVDISINIVSMFAFIVALGIVVDDAIVAGEAIYEARVERGLPGFRAAVEGTRSVASPITFSILTTVVAFLPIAFMPGVIGKIWIVIPTVVITVFLISWVESLFILPSHLRHLPLKERNIPVISWIQGGAARGLAWVVKHLYLPVLRTCLRMPFLTVVSSLGLFVIAAAMIKGGHVREILMPRLEADYSAVSVQLPPGTHASRSEAARKQIVDALDRVVGKLGGEGVLTGVYSEVNGNTIEAFAYLPPPDDRKVSTRDLTMSWRRETGDIVGSTRARFESDRGGPGSGAAITVELRHNNYQVLEEASLRLGAMLGEFSVVNDIEIGFDQGATELNFELTDYGASQAISLVDIATQIGGRFYGAQALRQPRGRTETRLLVRLSEDERNNLYFLERMRIRLPSGGLTTLSEIATVTARPAPTRIERRNGKQKVTVSAGVNPVGETQRVKSALDDSVLPQLVAEFPGLSYGYEGRQRDRRRSTDALDRNLMLALIGMFVLLAMGLRSYTLPLVVMLSIPFGLVGAIAGHFLMGYDWSLLSRMGTIALCGVLINDALILVDYAKKRLELGDAPLQAALEAGRRRFRPVVLTTLTTFGGVAPIIFETSRQARFISPMALSLGYGIVFATAVTLVVVPCGFYIWASFIRRDLATTGEIDVEGKPSHVYPLA